MSDNPRLRQLLDELHESHDTPEEVCRSCPELLPEVQARWRAVCRVRAEVDALFPSPSGPGVGALASDSLPGTLAVIERGRCEGAHIGAQVYAELAGTVRADLAVGEARRGVALARDSLMLWMSAVKPVAAVAILTHGNAWALGLVPGITLALTNRWYLMGRPGFWLAAVPVLANGSKASAIIAGPTRLTFMMARKSPMLGEMPTTCAS